MTGLLGNRAKAKRDGAIANGQIRGSEKSKVSYCGLTVRWRLDQWEEQLLIACG